MFKKDNYFRGKNTYNFLGKDTLDLLSTVNSIVFLDSFIILPYLSKLDCLKLEENNIFKILHSFLKLPVQYISTALCLYTCGRQNNCPPEMSES